MKLSLALFVMAATALPASAQQEQKPDSALSGLARCAEITGEQARLACYDAEAGRLVQDEAAGEVVAVSREDIRNIERDAFGFNMPSLNSVTSGIGNMFSGAGNSGGEFEPVDSITLQIERVEEFGYDKKRFFMANGQVWQQEDTAHVGRVRPGDSAVVRGGVVGGYMMRIDGGRNLRVERVQ